VVAVRVACDYRYPVSPRGFPHTALSSRLRFVGVRVRFRSSPGNGRESGQISPMDWLENPAIVTYSNAQTLKRQIMRLPHSRAFSLLWAGFIIAVPFAQLVGHGAFLQIVMGDDYSRNYPRIIEELGEFMGYVLLLIGGFELILQLRAARPGDYRPLSFDS